MASTFPRSGTEAEQAIFGQRETMFAGAAVHAAFYGCSIPLFLGSMYVQRVHRSRSGTRIGRYIPLHLSMMFLLSTILVITHLQFYSLTLITHASDPSYAGILNTPFHIITNFCLGAGAVLADALIIWRCYVLWDSNWIIILLPSLLTLGTFVTTLIWLISISQNSSKGFIDFGFIVTGLSVSTNFLVTALIALRILYTARRLSRVLGKERVSPYISAVGIVIESAALYAVASLVYVVTFALGSSSEQVTSAIYANMAAISAYLVVIRVGLGIDIQKEATTVLPSKMVFRDRNRGGGTTTTMMALDDTMFGDVDLTLDTDMDVGGRSLGFGYPCLVTPVSVSTPTPTGGDVGLGLDNGFGGCIAVSVSETKTTEVETEKMEMNQDRDLEQGRHDS